LLRSRIDALGEGALFRAEDIAADDPDLLASFATMRGHDWFHVADGLCTGVVETPYLRRMPKLRCFLDSVRREFGLDALVPFGDWAAWETGLFPHEPFAGYRYYCQELRADLAYGRYTKIHLFPAPYAWLMRQDGAARLLRAFWDMPDKQHAAMLDSLDQPYCRVERTDIEDAMGLVGHIACDAEPADAARLSTIAGLLASWMERPQTPED